MNNRSNNNDHRSKSYGNFNRNNSSRSFSHNNQSSSSSSSSATTHLNKSCSESRFYTNDRNKYKRARYDDNDSKRNSVRFKENVKFNNDSDSEDDHGDENDDDDDGGGGTALNEAEEDKYVEPAYIQSTSIPIYYQKNPTNAKLTDGTERLKQLCQKFETEMVRRSKTIREQNASQSTTVPDYRKLIQTEKFSNFSTCTCDHNKTEKDTKRCSKHSKKPSKKRHLSDSDSSSALSPFNISSSSSSSGISSSSDDESADVVDKKKSVKQKRKPNDNASDPEEFDDIRSMEINRKLNHPERLHPDLNFNEPDQTNEGPLCKCKLKNTTFGTRHQIYYGETAIPMCVDYCNNSERLYHYRMTIKPYTNFMQKLPTSIEFDAHQYVFEGFSIFSHEPLDLNMPDCIVVVYNHEYKLNLVKEQMIENFTIKELELLREYLFEEILELCDLKWKGYNVTVGCNRVHVLPRFSRTLPYNGKEILSPCEIIKFFLSNNKLVVSDSLLGKITQLSENEWLDYVDRIQGTLVTCPSKRPTSIRLDQLDRDHLTQATAATTIKTRYPLIIHFNMFRNTWLPMIKNDLKLKKLYHKYFKLRHLLNNKEKLTTDDKVKLRVLGDELQQMIRKSSETSKEIMIELSSEGFYGTGIRTDIVQQAVLIPTFVEHIRFHLSLKYLEQKIDYKFKDRKYLQFALTHPSGAFLLHQNLGSNPDHVRNALNNCRARNPNYGDLTPQKRKSLLRKKGIHMLFSIMSQNAKDNEESSCVSNYERLEFLGDKILELLISRHLFFLFTMFDEGQLSEYRNALVQNQYLAVLAKKLDMHYFIIFYHGVDLCSNSALNHALANSFEALLAAIYLDSDLDTVSRMLGSILWDDDEELRLTWSNLPVHPIQAQLPEGDRHLIPNIKILQHVEKFEEMIGVEFRHIRLLAQAFCTRSASFNLITLGDNQRLEFLGDTVLNFVVSDYLFRFFPKHHEGHLSLLRSSLVCNSTQSLLYDELGMSDFVLTTFLNANSSSNANKNENNANLKRKADVFEAFIGALYIDQDLIAIRTFCNVCMFNKLQDIILYQFWNDPKSRLQQCCLSLRDVDDSKPALPTYKLIEEKGPPNHKKYTVAVYFHRERIGVGTGKSIHEAEVEAAKSALKSKSDMFPILNKYVSHEMGLAQSRENSGKEETIKVTQNKKRNENRGDLEEGECNEPNEQTQSESKQSEKDFPLYKDRRYRQEDRNTTRDKQERNNSHNNRDNRRSDRYNSRRFDNNRNYNRPVNEQPRRVLPQTPTPTPHQPVPVQTVQNYSSNMNRDPNAQNFQMQRFNRPFCPPPYSHLSPHANVRSQAPQMRCPFPQHSPGQPYQPQYYDSNPRYSNGQGYSNNNQYDNQAYSQAHYQMPPQAPRAVRPLYMNQQQQQQPIRYRLPYNSNNYPNM